MKGSILSLAVLVALQASAQVPGDIPANGLVAWWSLSGDATDDANAHDGTSFSTFPATDRFGAADGAMDFSLGSYITVPASTAFNTGNGMTVAVWVDLLDPSANQKIMGRTNYGFNSGFILGVEGAGLSPEVWDANGIQYAFNEGAIEAGTWTHLAITWASNGQFIGYINGEVVGTLSTGAAGIGANNEPMIIGGSPWSQSPLYFATNGGIDDMGLWDRALSSDEIAELVAAGAVGVRETTGGIMMSVFPDPASSTITVEVPGETGMRRYVIIDALGAVAMKGTLMGGRNGLSVEALAPGVHLLRTEDGAVVRFCKE